MDKDKITNILKELNKEGDWNHYFELGDGIQTISKEQIPNSNGFNLRKWERIKDLIPQEYFTNKNILDVGCSDGFFSLKASQFANNVIGIDLDESRIKKANFIKSHFELKNCNFYNKVLMDFENEQFDICLLLGLIHRLPDPISFLTQISKISDEVVIEYKCYKSKKNLAFYGGDQKKSNKFNRLYFLFSPTCLESILKNLGFKIVAFEKLSFLNKLKFPRHIIHAKKI